MAAYPIAPLNAPAPPGVIGKPSFLADIYAALLDQWIQISRIGHVQRLVMRGKINSLGERKFTLTANSTTTTFTDERLTPDSYIGWMPLTATAAAATGVYPSSMNNGSCTINHNSTADTDRDFRMLIIG